VQQLTEKLNTPVQGTGADELKRALALLWERRRSAWVGWGSSRVDSPRIFLVTKRSMAPFRHP